MEKKFKGGSIKYRLPNYADTMVMYGKAGLAQTNSLVMMGEFLRHMGFMVEEIKIGGIDSYETLLSSKKYAKELATIANEMMTSMMEFTEEKKSDSES